MSTEQIQNYSQSEEWKIPKSSFIILFVMLVTVAFIEVLAYTGFGIHTGTALWLLLGNAWLTSSLLGSFILFLFSKPQQREILIVIVLGLFLEFFFGKNIQCLPNFVELGGRLRSGKLIHSRRPRTLLKE